MSSAATTSRRPTLWVGWIAFAGFMMVMTGLFNLISGLTAVFSDKVYIGGPRVGTLVLDVTGWGWVHVILGLVLVATGVALLMGQWWARAAAIGFVALNLITQMALLPAYPFWALLTIAVDILVVWAITVHGDELART